MHVNNTDEMSSFKFKINSFHLQPNEQIVNKLFDIVLDLIPEQNDSKLKLYGLIALLAVYPCPMS